MSSTRNSLVMLGETSSIPQTSLEKGNTSNRTIDSVSSQESCQQIVLSLEADAEDILNCFEELASKMRFEMIERENCNATALRQNQNGGILSIFGCLSWMGSGSAQSAVTAVKIQIQDGKAQNQKICILRGLSGGIKQVGLFFREFSKTVEPFQTDNDMFFCAEEAKGDSQLEQPSNPFYAENCARFLVGKMLANVHCEAGKFANSKITQLFEAIKAAEQYSSDKKEVLKLMRIIMTTIEKTVKILDRDLKSHSESYNTIEPYIRCSVESYIFDHIGDKVHKHYESIAKDASDGFMKKRNTIFERLSLNQIIEQTTLSKKFTFLTNESILSQQYHPSKTISLLGYGDACKQLQKLMETNPSNPREKMNCLRSMQAKLRSLIFERSGRKYELANMDDVLPAMIMMVLLCGNQFLRRDLSILKDFIDEDPCENFADQRLVLNLIEAMNYVERQWQLPQKN